MKRYPSLLFQFLFTATCAVVLAGWLLQLALPHATGDPFDQTNQTKLDPFSEANKAPAIDWDKINGQPQPVLNADSVQSITVPKIPANLEEKIDFQVIVSPQGAIRGQTVKVIVEGTPRPGFYTYSMTKVTENQSGPAISTFKVGVTPDLRPLPSISESEPELVKNEKLNESYYEHSGVFTWTFDLLIQPNAIIGDVEFLFDLALQVCSESGCTPGEIGLKAVFKITSAPAVALSPNLKARLDQRFPPAPMVLTQAGVVAPPGAASTKKAEELSVSNAPSIPSDYQPSIDRIKQQITAPQAPPMEGLLSFMLTGMFWGFVSLITPCVFPMIPITVSFFLKQSEKEHHRPVTMALVYCGTIVVILTFAAAALLNFFRVLSISPLMNFGLGALFIFFALSLFGMYEIELPSFLARYTSEREGRGGMVGTMFMALTFTIISFACVAPFLGGFGGTADTAARPFWHTILGGLAFSMTFAAPFFVLALFPTWLRALPKSGSWLNAVKVVMGFLELAAALKFFRAGELVLASPLGVFTFDFVLGLWIALCILCGLYLLGTYRLPHDSPSESLSVPRMLFAFSFLGLGLYMLPALFLKSADGQETRPSGVIYAWINSFLLPDPAPNAAGEVWSPNLENAIAQAHNFRKRTGKAKLVFIDFTGEVCTNCKLNEHNVFNKSEIQKLFKPYQLVKLYCDTIPLKYYSAQDRPAAEAGRRSTDGKINYDFQAKVFNGVELPLYVILEPLPDGTIKVVAKYTKGLIRNETEFAAFLTEPLSAGGTVVASR